MESKLVALHDASSSFMRRIICYNQGEYVQYNFLAAERHKALKESWRKSPNDAKDLHERCDELASFLNTNLNRVSQKNFAFIKEYFSGRHPIEPRVCVKGNFRDNEKDYVVQLIRDKKVNYLSEYPLESNSGFLHVKNKGTYFVCNDIPKSIADGKYRNARINTELAKEYYKQRSYEPLASSKEGFLFDESWIKCWNPPTHDNVLEPESCYKCTVIIPMTLWNNDLAQEFLEKMQIKAKSAKALRTIFGYLCFDHIEEDYFNDSTDIDVGYIFADILSLYMITVYIYTEISDTFSAVMSSLQQEIA